ncbi:unnamed protein product [Alternaria burnsii]|nr:unnamed protein product [Alternaria burnsii]
MASESDPRYTVANLPQTFQEAIEVSKKLGVWYLWIDSLCIIQSGDDRQDWYREASLMEKVYMHSHCNISAMDAEDSTKGLFRHRAPLYIGCPCVKVSLDDIRPDTEHVECLMTDCLLWRDVLKYSPLNKRGWVFQERYLAPRVLHFGRTQLFWECREHTVCETFPRALPSVILRNFPPSLKSREQNEQHVSGEMFPQRRIREKSNETNWETLWYALVREYSLKELSVPGDKLVALSGVARHMMSRIKDIYVAGMWRRSLESMLAWTVTGIGKRPSNYRAPSWSWASVNGLIWLDSGVEQKSLIHVEDVVLNHATEDITGAVVGGWLDLRGSLKPMRLQSFKYDEAIYWNMVVGSSTITKHGVDDTNEGLSVRLDTLYGEAAFDNDNTEERLFSMPALIGRSSYGNHEVRCLLLRLTNSKSKIFERIGCVEGYSKHGEDVLLAELDEETKAGLPCLRYENGLHTIRII